MIDWLIQEDIFDEGLESLLAAIKDQGFKAEVVKYVPFNAGQYDQFPDNSCVISYGSLNLVTQLQREKKWIPGAWCILRRLRCQVYYTHWGPAILNQSHVFTTYGELIRRKDMFFEKFGIDGAIFVRPDSGFKQFTGSVVYKENFDELDRVDPEELVVVAEPRNIEGEWRFIIAEGEVITGSQYRLDGELDVSPAYDTDAYNLAQKTALVDFQPDRIYALDICKSDGVMWILEANSFSCSGFYACDIQKIVSAASKVALKEWQEYYG